MGNPSLGDNEKEELMQRYNAYAQLAEDYSSIPNRYFIATVGLSASGKTCVSAALAGELGLIRLRSDVERKRLHGLAPLDRSQSDTGGNLYSVEANTKTYERLAKLASGLLAAGFPVIADTACLKEQERALFAAVAESQGVPFALIHCEAPEGLRKEWVRKRKDDASEATEALLDAQKDWFEPLTAEEKTYTAHLRTDQEHVAEAVADRIRQHFGLTPQVSS
jgi:predicted kinase